MLLVIAEFSLNRPVGMTADGLHHLFSIKTRPDPDRPDSFLARLVQEAGIWASQIRKAPAPLVLEELLQMTPDHGLARLLVPESAYLYVEWLVIRGRPIHYFDGSWLAERGGGCEP